MMLPELRLADWRATKDTLHLYCQIVGKIRLATTTPRNHGWNVPLYVDVRGLSTRRLHHYGTTFEITIDFTDHALAVRTADARTRSFGLGRAALASSASLQPATAAGPHRVVSFHQGHRVRDPAIDRDPVTAAR